MLKIKTDNETPEFIKVNLCGRFTGEYVPEVEKALSPTDAKPKKLALDLAEVTLVDRAAIAFLCAARAIAFLCAARSRNIAIHNAPLYVRLWMEQEGCKGPLHLD